MPDDSYAAQMLEYYTRRIDPLHDKSGRQYAEESDREFAIEGHHARDLGLAVQSAFVGRDILELAAGMGRWSRYALHTVDSILATDASPRSLDRLQDGASFGLESLARKFTMMPLDAFMPDGAPGMFSGALAVNWFQHMPREFIGEWITRLHHKLLPRAIVLIAINHLSPKSRSKLFSKKGDPNLYENRQTFDGQSIDIIDNVFSEPDLREIFSPHAKTISYTCGVGYYWVSYELP